MYGWMGGWADESIDALTDGEIVEERERGKEG